MIALLGSLLGFLGSGIPSVFNYFQDKADKLHELNIMRLQMDMQKLECGEQLREIGIQANVAEQQTLYKTYNVGIKWVDAFNGMVRPIISYAFFIIYAAIKITQIIIMDDISSDDQIHIIWTDNDQFVMSAIVSYYFGDQAFNR